MPTGACSGRPKTAARATQGVIFRLSFSGAPQITSQPASQSVYAGDNVVLSVAVVGASPFSYQWQKNGTNLVDGGNLSGATSRVLTLTNVTTNDAGTYSVLVSNPAGSTQQRRRAAPGYLVPARDCHGADQPGPQRLHHRLVQRGSGRQ